jgi:branched-subunit amino acid transport protein
MLIAVLTRSLFYTLVVGIGLMATANWFIGV